MDHKREQYSFAFERFSNKKCIVRATKRVYERNYQTVYHNHDYPQIWYCYKGSYQHNLEGEIYDCREGSLMVIPSGVRHDVRFLDEDAEVLALDVFYTAILSADPEAYTNMIASLCLPTFSKELGYNVPMFRMLTTPSQKIAEEVFSWFVLSNYATERTPGEEEVFQKLNELFSIAECALPDKFHKKAVSIAYNWIYPAYRIIDYLNIHYPEKILEDALLAVGGLSHSGLNRYFKRVSGCSYSQYLLQLRVKRAYIYIRTTTYSLSYISDMCGFYDPYHMSSAFHKYIGDRPKKRSMKLREYYGNKK